MRVQAFRSANMSIPAQVNFLVIVVQCNASICVVLPKGCKIDDFLVVVIRRYVQSLVG